MPTKNFPSQKKHNTEAFPPKHSQHGGARLFTTSMKIIALYVRTLTFILHVDPHTVLKFYYYRQKYALDIFLSFPLCFINGLKYKNVHPGIKPTQ